jgi:2-keto-4-pentenoate hydratase
METYVASSAVLQSLAEGMRTLFQDHDITRPVDGALLDLSLEEAYDVQSRYIALRAADGEQPVGWKVGCTSRAVQGQFGLTTPVHGRLLRPHMHENGAHLPYSGFHGCAVEPELVLVMAERVSDPDLPDADLVAAIGEVRPGIELHNYTFMHGPPSSQELIASNAIHAGLVIGGPGLPAADMDLAMEGVGLWVNGVLATSALAAEILGAGPLASLRWLVTRLRESGRVLEPGELVIPGSPVGLVRVSAGDSVTARFTTAGRCEARFDSEVSGPP